MAISEDIRNIVDNIRCTISTVTDGAGILEDLSDGAGMTDGLRKADDDMLLLQILSSYDDTVYPEGFLNRFDIVECLAERNGVDTFVVLDDKGVKYIAKCYDRDVWSFANEENILSMLNDVSDAGDEEAKNAAAGIPRYYGSYSNEYMVVTVREFIDGVPLDRYAAENELRREEITEICLKICDILARLHHRDEPVIHRDIKPQNIIISKAGSDPDDLDNGEAKTSAPASVTFDVTLIDFDIARVYHSGSDTDTRFFGTMAYAPPEQYGFSQTDARADIYALGVLLRYLLTGSTRENKNVTVYKPLASVISKCTAFSPEDRYADIDQVSKALRESYPDAQRRRIIKTVLCAVAAAAVVLFLGTQIYKAVTWTPFNDDAIPAFESDSDRIADAVSYMNSKYDTDLFSGGTETLESLGITHDNAEGPDEVATIGLLRKVLIDVYGLDKDYVYGENTEIPNESEDFFLPWMWDDHQTITRDTMVYAAVKVMDPSIVADWSSLKDDTGDYPGTRVALEFAERTGILTGANRPDDLTVGDMALIFANTERVFDAASGSE